MNNIKIKQVGHISSNGQDSSNIDWFHIFPLSTLGDYDTWKEIDKNYPHYFCNDKIFRSVLDLESFGSSITIYELLEPNKEKNIVCIFGFSRFPKKIFNEYLDIKPAFIENKKVTINVKDETLIFSYFNHFDLLLPNFFHGENNKKTKESEKEFKLFLEHQFKEVCLAKYQNELRLYNILFDAEMKMGDIDIPKKPKDDSAPKIKVKNGKYKIYNLVLNVNLGEYEKGEMIGYLLSLNSNLLSI